MRGDAGGDADTGGSTWLVLSVAASWVAVAQLARAAEVTAERLQGHSIVPLMTLANATAWIVLAIPHAVRQSRRGREGAEGGGGVGLPGLLGLLRTRAFQVWQPPQFLALALGTNLCYIAALHYLPASLNTAIFCSSPVFTLLLSAAWLSREAGSPVGPRQVVTVALSVLGVLLVAEPWRPPAATETDDAARRPGGAPGTGPGQGGDRVAGACFSLLAAAGTALYQVRFKWTFGDRMGPEEVGLFLAHMGLLCCVLGGLLCAALVSGGLYRLDLRLVPWDLVAATALSSALFNFLIKFGISRGSPLSMSVATQIGIPLNLLLDVFVVRAPIRGVQAVGCLALLASFSAQQQAQFPWRVAPARERLLGAEPADQ